MAKLEYNEALVDQSLSILKQAETQVSNTGTKVVSALGTVAGARGANYLDINAMLGAGGLNESCIELIEQTVTGINQRVEMVKQYNEDYENAGFFEKVFSSVGLVAAKFTEGIFGAGEQIIDGFASATGLVVGLFSKDAKEAIGEFIKKDHVGDYFKAKYDNEWSDMVKYSYFKEDGFVATAAKIFGTSAGYTAALAIGGGVLGATKATAGLTTSAKILRGAKAATMSVKSAALLAGIGGMGSGTQAGLLSGKSYNEAAWLGAKIGVGQAATVFVVDWGMKKLSKAWAKFKSGGAADDVAGAADDMARAGRTPDGPDGPVVDGPDGPVVDGPDGPTGTGPNGTGGSTGTNGTGGPTGPNGTGGPTRTNGTGGPKGTNGTGGPTGTNGTGGPKGSSRGAGGATGAGTASPTQAADDLLHAAGKSDADMLDDLYRAVERGDITPDAAKQAIENKFKEGFRTAANRKEFAKMWHPDKHGAALDNLAKAGSNPVAGGSSVVDDAVDAATDLGKAAGSSSRTNPISSSPVDDAVDAASDIGRNAGTTSTGTPKPGEAIQLGGSSPVDDAVDAASDIGRNAGTTSTAPRPKPGEVIQLGGSSPVDEAVDAASDIGRNAGTTSTGTPKPGEVIQLGSGSPVDEVVDAAGDAVQAASSSSRVSQMSDELASAYNDYDDLLLRRDELYNQLTDLGGKAGNAPTDEFLLIRSQIDEVDDLIAQAGQKIANLSTPTGTNLPAVQQPSSTALAVIDDVKLPAVQQPSSTALAVIDDAKLPAVQQPSSTALAVIDDTKLPVGQQSGSTALAVIDDTKLPANVTDPTDLVPYNPDPTDLVPYNPGPTDLVPYNPDPTNLVPYKTDPTDLVPYNPEPTDIVPYTPAPKPVVPEPAPTPVVPTPVPTPVPVVPTPVPVVPTPVPTPVPIVPVPVPIEPTPTPVPIDPAPVPIVPTDPVVTPNPPVITPDPTPVTPTPTPVTPTPTPVTPDPTPVVPENPVPTPPEEYAPIPNTGIAGTGKTILDYLAPGLAGAALGLTGVLGTKALKDKKDDEDEDEF